MYQKPYHLRVLIVLKSGSLNLLEPSGPVQGLLFYFYMYQTLCHCLYFHLCQC